MPRKAKIASAARRLRRRLTRERGEFAQAVLESLPEPVMACDVRERPIVFNRRARELHGVEARPAHGDEWPVYYDAFGAEGTALRGSDDLPLSRALRGEHVHDARLVIRPAGAAARRVSVEAAPVRDEDAQIDGAVAVIHEIAGADSDPADPGSELLASALARLPSAISLVSASDGRIIYANRSWNALFGYRHGEVLGSRLSIVTAPSDEQFPGERVREIVEALDHKGAWRGNVHNIRKDGAQVLCSETISQFEDERFGPVWLTVYTEVPA